METAAELLKEVAFKVGTLREARKQFAVQLAPDFNVFDYLRTDEMGISKVIADLLYPKGAHGQSGVYLQAFAKILGQGAEWIASTNDWRVVTEQQANGQRRIDVYLESDIGVIGIENKPWASDQENQLSDYADYLETRAANKKWLLIYLSNSEPEPRSISKEKRKILENIKKLILLDFYSLTDWLNECAAQTRALVVRVFIEELAKFVRSNINGELDMSEEKEVIGEITKSPENIAAAFHVSNAMAALKQGLLQKLHDDLKSLLDKKGFHLVWDAGMSQGWKTWVGFGVKFDQQDKYLRIEFDGSGLHGAFWGVRRESDAVERDSIIWQGIHEVMQNQFGHGKKSEWWPWYSALPDAEFVKEYRDWGISEKPWIEMVDGKLAKNIADLSDRVYKAFQDSQKKHLLQAKAD